MSKRKKADASANAADKLLYKTIEPLAEYIDRIGAEPIGMLRFAVCDEVDGYKRELTRILVSPDGEIKISGRNADELAPTNKESAAIKKAVPKAKIPRSIPALNTDRLEKQLGPEAGELFACHVKDGIAFVQERRDDKGGKYRPWTFFDDGQWRMLEPDDGLPIFGLDQTRRKVRRMYHEGAKAARAMHKLLADNTLDHPLKRWLADYDHFGWLGGTQRVYATDWRAHFRDVPPQHHVVFAADNDETGIEAVVKISQIIRRSMDMVKFGESFRQAFDFADPWPADLDCTLNDLIVPATWATKVVHINEAGRPSFKITDEFRKDWVAVTKPAVFIHKRQVDRTFNDAQFNRRVRPFSDAEDTARLMIKIESSRCDALTYDPSQKSGVVVEDGMTAFNSYRPSSVMPKEGDAKPFLDFMEHLIPEQDDRHEVLRWIATLIARPDLKMKYGLLLISETQGVGKGTLAEKVLAPILGEWNCSFPSEGDIVSANFNYWQAHKRLAVCHEVYQGHSWKAYNTLKSVITDDFITVRKKFQDEYDIRNWMHILACSNSLVPMKVSLDDRRWLVPMVTEEKRPKEYWLELNAWLSADGPGIILNWAQEFLKEHRPVLSGEEAPMTSRKADLARDGFTPGQELIWNLCKLVAAMKEQKVLAVNDLRDFIRNSCFDGRENKAIDRPAAIRKAAVAAGLFEPERRGRGKQHEYQVDGKDSYLVANFKIANGVRWPDLKECRMTTQAMHNLMDGARHM
jgi:Family of unknown function (DUF5906)